MIKLSSTKYQASAESIKASQLALESVLKNKDLGFHQLPIRSILWESCQELANTLRMKYSKLVVLGIGGSSLGGKVIQEVFSRSSDKAVLFLDSIDPLYLDSILHQFRDELHTMGWAIISKSGNTIETLTQADYINQFYKKHNVNWLKQCIVVTEAKSSPLGDFANHHQIPRLEVPLDVGGRFSVLSPVGMLPAAFMGLDLNAFREGAQDAIKSSELISQFVSLTEMSFQRQEWITVFWSYSNLLKEFGFWVQQLWAESLGKKRDRLGNPALRASTPLPCLGPTDQHSILQQIAEGAKDKFVIFLRHEKSESQGDLIEQSLFSCGDLMIGKRMGELLATEAVATQMGLEQHQVSTLTLKVSRLSEREVAYLFMFFELVVATLAEKLNINGFDQPGVELGKIIAKDILLGK